MRYKGTFDGTSLLCPYTRLFVPFPLTVKALDAKSSILCPDKEAAERIHEESMKEGEEFIHYMPYLHYDGEKYHVLGWDALQEYPECSERVRAIQNCIPRCGGYLFLFSCSVSSLTVASHGTPRLDPSHSVNTPDNSKACVPSNSIISI